MTLVFIVYSGRARSTVSHSRFQRRIFHSPRTVPSFSLRPDDPRVNAGETLGRRNVNRTPRLHSVDLYTKKGSLHLLRVAREVR